MGMIVLETFGAELERSTLEMGEGSDEEPPPIKKKKNHIVVQPFFQRQEFDPDLFHDRLPGHVHAQPCADGLGLGGGQVGTGRCCRLQTRPRAAA